MKYDKRPPRSAAEAKKRVNEYFESRKVPLVDKNGEPKLGRDGEEIKVSQIPPTLTGLALALGYNTREELFEKRDSDIGRVISRAVMRIEEYAEERLFSKEGFSGVKLFLEVNFERWRGADTTSGEYEIPEEVKPWTV